MGDKISKSKADNILNVNVSNLAKEYSTKIPYWDKMNSSQKSGLLVLGYNAPYGPIGAYPKLTSALQQGDMRSAAQHLQRGGPNASRIALERNLLLSGPTNLKNLVGPKIVGEKKVGSGIPFVPPVLYNLQQRMQKKQGGGVVEESDGSRNPHSSSDRRMFPITNTPNLMGMVALQPGEGIVTKRAMESGGKSLIENINATLDPNSEAAKSGVKGLLSPPQIMSTQNISSGGQARLAKRQNALKSSGITPPSQPPVNVITKSNRKRGAHMGMNKGTSSGPTIPNFSASSGSRSRRRTAATYGIG
jgi:hypothetical protein